MKYTENIFVGTIDWFKNWLELMALEDGYIWKTLGMFFTGMMYLFSPLILSFLIMLAWNFVMPVVFGLKILTFWQAFALWFLFSVFRGDTRIVSNIGVKPEKPNLDPPEK